jgi:DUF1680 family protein
MTNTPAVQPPTGGPAAGSGATPLPLTDVVIDDAFWTPRITTVRERTIPFQHHQLERIGHLDNLRRPVPADAPKPHIFWDSDIAKWIEAASYSLATHPDPVLDAQIDEAIALLAGAQGDDGYLNTYFTVVEPDARFTDLRDAHELYCAGHLIEAAVAHHTATGKTSLLDIMCRYADYIGSVFGRGEGQIRGYDGHEEIELALVKLYEATGKQAYLDLATYFTEERGTEPYFFDLETKRRGTPGWFASEFDARPGHPGRTREYLQAHAPVREQTEAVGHSVRAMYLYSAMADLARENGDHTLLDACRRLWEHLTTRRMYVTGGIGSSAVNEGFTTDFDLPNETAYAETCASIGLMMWAQRMLRIDRQRRYGDVMELALYNGVLSGLSADGTTFFYDNPLGSAGGVSRHDWFEVACCPPNLARVLSSLGSYAYAQGLDELVVHLYLAGTIRFSVAGHEAVVRLDSNYPWDGRIRLTVEHAPAAPFTLSMRVPEWTSQPTLLRNGEPVEAILGGDGYLSVTGNWTEGDELELVLDSEPRRLWADPRVRSLAGRVTVARGPLIYAAEEADNGAGLDQVLLPRDAQLGSEPAAGLDGVLALRASGLRETHVGGGLYRTAPPFAQSADVTLVPYHAWANRGAGEMRVWLRDCQLADRHPDGG